MSSFSSSGIKYKRENFRALKDEMQNIRFDINKEMSHVAVALNDKNEYIFRVQNRDSYFSRPNAEERYLFNQILKHYELSGNHLPQGFNNKYFSKLSDLMSLKNISTNEYSKKRIELFNSRINENHKSYINYLKKKGGDINLQSTINKKLNPMNMTFSIKLRNKMFNLKYQKNKNNQNIIRRSKILSIIRHTSKTGFHPDYTLSSFNQYRKNIKYRNEPSLSTARDESSNSRRYLKNKNTINAINKSSSKYNTKKNNDIKFTNSFSLPQVDFNNQNEVDNDSNIKEKLEKEMEIKEKKSKEEFLSTYNKTNYINFLKLKYHFIEDKNYEGKQRKITFKDIKRRNMFRFKPKNKFILKKEKDNDKIIFFKKIDNECNKQSKSMIRIKKPKQFFGIPVFHNKIVNKSLN